MDSRAVIPNCPSIPPFLRTITAGGCYQRSGTVTVLRHSWPARRSKPCLSSGPREAMRDFGAVGELPETKCNFYELLGIPASGSYDDIKRAYKHLARKYHPDVSPPDLTEEYTRRFIEVKEAYEILSDPGHRALYDRHLGRGLQLAFSTRRHFDKDKEEKTWWRNRCEEQLAGLSRKSMRKNSDENLSWGARMRRRRRAESSAC
uniref:Chaperone protein DnaJ 20 isoform X1 n=1 Tax=Cymbidium ensifolium TaxID=78740 RepID=A0A5B9MTB2_CYMEN|nr:chaperone protein DnaJ 20 isoform X1 [Cymbidium ensifolium]